MAREMTAEEIDALLEEQYVVRIGCRRGDEIFVVPVAFAREGRSLFAFSYEGRKIEMMRVNPRVCVELDLVVDLGQWRSVIGWGEFEELEGAERRAAMERLAHRLGPELHDETSRNRLDRAMADDPPPIVFRIELETVTGRVEG